MTPNPCYDVIVIGAGPAGLSAARTVADQGLGTLLLEKLPRAGALDHPCSGVITPDPAFVSGQWLGNRLHFPALDLVIPNALIMGQPTAQRYLSPGGYEFQISFTDGDDRPIAAVHKSALLWLIAEQAQTSGAELRYDTPAIGLLREDDRIVGVRTPTEEIHSRIVLSAEGVIRQFCQEARLFADSPPTERYAFIVNEELAAPVVQAHHAGRITTLGQRYTSATRAVGTVVMPTAGQANVYFSVFVKESQSITDTLLDFYLEEYKQRDPRVRTLFVGSKPLHRTTYVMPVRDAPPQVVRDGFIGVGDAVTEGGRQGILSAMYMGRQAALVSAEAIRGRDVTADVLAALDRLYQGPVLRKRKTSGRLMIELADMTDDALDWLCLEMSKIHLEMPLADRFSPIPQEMSDWEDGEYQQNLPHWGLLQGTMTPG